ncbi:MAG: hypothetical protein LH467_10400 [Gemmatimonadaceae bacterium]|nr:hypothetical protein [Gemmatimonadaceae bacterium]
MTTHAGQASKRSMLFFLCVIFVLSGAAGLVYESIWTRYLGLFVGHGAYAQVLVLVIFLGGMSNDVRGQLLTAWIVAAERGSPTLRSSTR